MNPGSFGISKNVKSSEHSAAGISMKNMKFGGFFVFLEG